MILQNPKYKSLSVSLLIHVTLLLILAVFAITPKVSLKWFEFDFYNPDLEEEPPPQTTNSSATEQANAPSESATLPAPAKNTQSTNPPQNSAITKPADPTIETPSIEEDVKSPPKINISNNPNLKNVLKGLQSGTSPSQGSVNIAVEGGGIVPKLPQGLKHSLGEPGWVVLSFELDEYAKVIPSSVETLQQSNNRFIEEAKSVLRKCSFSFKGAPETGISYKIRINFL